MPRNISGLKIGPGPGRPKGCKNKHTKAMLEFFESCSTDPTWQASAWKRILAGKAPHLETYMVQKVGGKPTDVVEHHGDIPAAVTFVIAAQPGAENRD